MGVVWRELTQKRCWERLRTNAKYWWTNWTESYWLRRPCTDSCSMGFLMNLRFTKTKPSISNSGSEIGLLLWTSLSSISIQTNATWKFTWVRGLKSPPRPKMTNYFTQKCELMVCLKSLGHSNSFMIGSTCRQCQRMAVGLGFIVNLKRSNDRSPDPKIPYKRTSSSSRLGRALARRSSRGWIRQCTVFWMTRSSWKWRRIF